MSSLTSIQRDDLSALILHALSQTPYACSSLTQLSGGTVNFVFRGVLVLSLASTASRGTIIIKHSRDSIAFNKNFPLDVSRCIAEESMLHGLKDFPSPTARIKTPRLYLFSQETNTQVLEDFPGTTDLKSLLVLPNAADLLPRPVATCIGHDLGSWLRTFHTWTSALEQVGLRAQVRKNESMQRLKYKITYESFINILENFPESLERRRNDLQDVKDTVLEEFERATVSGGEGWGIIHGDLWGGNILISNTPSLDPGKTELCIIDWEFAQLGHRCFDLGQMIGDLYERKHFKDVESAIWIMEGFTDGYGEISDELAFRTAIHAGVHLICWYTRRPPTAPLTGTPEQIMAAVTLGRDLILKGREKDRAWFEGSVLAPLFRKRVD